MQDKNNYSAYDFDNLTEGEQMKINHSVYYNDDPDLSDLISKTLHEVMTMREESAAAEQAIYSKVREKAYAHLFTEISPPIPKEYEAPFKLYGHLLPGYTTEEMQRSKVAEKAADTKTQEKKPSIRQELKSIKSAEKGNPKPTKKRSEPEL